MTRALHDAGAGILLGTDALNPHHLPGYAAHEEPTYLAEVESKQVVICWAMVLVLK